MMDANGKYFAKKSAPPPPAEEVHEDPRPSGSSTPLDPDHDPMNISDPFIESLPSPVLNHDPVPPPPPPPPPPSSSAFLRERASVSTPHPPNNASPLYTPSQKSKRKGTKKGKGKENQEEEQNLDESVPPPNVDDLLASLEAQVNGPPKLPSDPFLPPPTPPPPATSSSSASAPPTSDSGSGSGATPGAGKKRKPRQTRQQKQQKADQAKGAQRTRAFEAGNSEDSQNPGSSDGRIKNGHPQNPAPRTLDTPGLNKTRANMDPSRNRPSDSLSTASGSATSSAYARKPGEEKAKFCRDITSSAFVPEDEDRVEIVLQTIMGENEGRNTKAAPSLIVHSMQPVISAEETGIPLHQAPGARPAWDEDKFLTVADFISRFPDPINVTIARKPSVPFLILHRPLNSKKRWQVPNFEDSADFVNDALSSMFHQDLPYAETYERSGKWGLFSTVYLNTTDPPAVEEFRRHLARWPFRGMDFDTFPKEAATMKSDISILLRNNMKLFQLEVLPKVLFIRNKDRLAGTLRILATRTFPEGETSHKGESKINWRQIELKGDDQVMRCLRFIPESFPFKLGVEPVQIKGGLRPQDMDENHNHLGKRSWSAAAAASATPPSAILAPSPIQSAAPTAPRGHPNKRGRGFGKGNFGRRK